MAATKKTVSVPEGYEVRETDRAGTFVKATEGLIIHGVLSRAFLIEGRACFRLDGVKIDDSGSTNGQWCIGERSSYGEELRNCRLGDSVWLQFVEKSKANKRGNTPWTTRLAVKAVGKGEKVGSVLSRIELAEEKRKPNTDEVPF